MGTSVISVIIVLGILIFVHELGHFLVAKWSGVGVLRFSLGFGPKLVSRKYGETEYALSAIPLGGYVRLLGEADDAGLSEEDRERSFQNQSVYKKIAIVAAGPLCNFLFAIVAFSIIFGLGVSVPTSRIGAVQEESPAQAAGLREGDLIREIDGHAIAHWEEMADVIRSSGGKPLKLLIERDEKRIEKTVTPRSMETETLFGEPATTYVIGVTMSSELMTDRKGPAGSVIAGVGQTWLWTKLTYTGIAKIVQRVVSPKELGGPILIAKMSGDMARQGLIPFIFFMAVLSVNLGVLNLLPIPVLDGGHLMFFAVELVTKREVSLKIREKAQTAGFFVLILLIFWVTYNDIVRIWGN
ncbi:MAG: RIP metalloprotease RseP [Syntrophales bacterium]|jgi:regulator of sigma E protease|nr:RIP metalloprotease RseP [Syntrophales bacterium]MCK9528210.1 RIP metalloprotease RseP [Syntrophales bacterium]MDX9921358.1 RIP metalloprotease RseP [Syntrophales bacterium]